MARNKIKPEDYGDFLSILSFLGFLLMFLESVSNFNFGSYSTSLFLIVSGSGLISIGRLLSISRWARDGIKGNQEFTWLFTSVFGISSIVVGILALPQIDMITPQLKGIITISSLVSMVFIFYQYVNRKC